MIAHSTLILDTKKSSLFLAAILIMVQNHTINTVIPAWMPESSHKDVKLRANTRLNQALM
jgi:hypothetical protein